MASCQRIDNSFQMDTSVMTRCSNASKWGGGGDNYQSILFIYKLENKQHILTISQAFKDKQAKFHNCLPCYRRVTTPNFGK
jgi:hypothetical protein